MHTVFAMLCFVVVIHWLIFPYPSGLLHWHCGNLTIAPVPAKQPWWIWINTSCEFIMNDCITTTKQSTTKPCAYFLGYTEAPDGLAPLPIIRPVMFPNRGRMEQWKYAYKKADVELISADPDTQQSHYETHKWYHLKKQQKQTTSRWTKRYVSHVLVNVSGAKPKKNKPNTDDEVSKIFTADTVTRFHATPKTRKHAIAQ